MLVIDLSGIKVYFHITDYVHSKDYDNTQTYDVWCTTNISFESEYLRYSTDNCCLLSWEVDEIYSTLNEFLNDELREDTALSFIEPDLCFRFHCKQDECYMELIVNIWDNGAMTDNYSSLCFDKDDCCKLRDYLLEIRNLSYGGRYSEKNYINNKPKFTIDSENKIRFIKIAIKPQSHCTYWYIDESGKIEKDTFVWVPIGQKDKPTLVLVKQAVDCNERNAPYAVSLTKKVLRIATEAEVEDSVWKVGEEEKYNYTKAHEFSANHKPELEKDKKCGCFFCLKIFSPKEIDDWIFDDNPIDKRGTAICPYCGIDSVIGESSGFPITKKFLTGMRREWFGTAK